MASPSLRWNFVWTLAGNAVFALGQFATIIAITKLGSTRLVGDWTLGLALTAPIFIFAQFKLRIVQTTDLRGHNQWGEYVALRLLGVGAALALVAVIVLVGYPDRTGAVVMLIALAKALDSASDLIYGQEQQREHLDRIARSLVGRGATSCAAGISVFWWTRSTIWAAAAVAASYIPWLIWDIARLRRLLGGAPLAPRWDRAPLGGLFRTVLPLGFVGAIGSLQVNVPRYFLEAYTSRAELGVFGTLSYLLLVGGMVVTAVAYAALPRLTRYVTDGQWVAFRRLLLRLVAIGLGLGVFAVLVALVAGERLLRLVYNDEIARHADVLVWIAVTSGLTWTYVFLGTTLDAMRKFSVQPWIICASTGVIALASAILVPRYRLLGATWAMLIGYAVECVLYCLAVAVPLWRQTAGIERP